MPNDDLAVALVDTSALGQFEGQDVLRAAIEIPNAAGGLRDAMKFAPLAFHHGDEVYVVLKCEVKKVRFDPIKDVEALARIHVFDALEATFVDESMVAAALKDQRERIEEAKAEAERAKGIHRLELDGPEGGEAGGADEGDEEPEEVALSRQHAAGVHADGDPRPGCPECDDEVAALAEEENQG